MPGLYSAGFLVLEGDYSSWAIYDSFDETDTAESGDGVAFAVFNRIETIAILSRVGGKSKTYTISSKTVSAAHSIVDPWNAYMTGKYMTSAYGTYHVVQDAFNQKVAIFKNGVELFYLDHDDLGIDAGGFGAISISPTGKYIAVAGKRTATGNVGWVILVGS